MNQLPAEDLPTPPHRELYALPYDKGILLHPPTKTRWYQTEEGLIRDLTGEEEWARMGDYVGKDYQQMFLDAYLQTHPTTFKS